MEEAREGLLRAYSNRDCGFWNEKRNAGRDKKKKKRIARVAYGVPVAVPGKKSSVGTGGGTISNPFLSVKVK